jgi:hypothetical protein
MIIFPCETADPNIAYLAFPLRAVGIAHTNHFWATGKKHPPFGRTETGIEGNMSDRHHIAKFSWSFGSDTRMDLK